MRARIRDALVVASLLAALYWVCSRITRAAWRAITGVAA